MKLSKLVLFIAAISSSGFAQDSTDQTDLDVFGIYGEEDFISIATGIAQPIAKAPAVASVITDEDIKKIGATDLDEVLETVPGLHVARDVNGYNPLYVFRGIYAGFNPQVLVLINGIPITNLFHGDRNVVWGGMPVESIARIEVIRGPGSALYGADAFAGVINIVTKGVDDLSGFSVGAKLGSFNTRNFWVSGGGELGNLKVSAILEVSSTDGQDEVIDADAQTFLDLITGTNASNAPGEVNLSSDKVDFRLETVYQNFKFRAGAQIRSDVGDGSGPGQVLNEYNNNNKI